MSDAILLPYQQKFTNDRTQVKIWEKSRRIGASWCEAADAALVSAKRREDGGMDTWYIGYNQDMAEEFIRDVAFWAKIFNDVALKIALEVLVDEDKDILIYRVTFASGFKVKALSSRPTNLRGKQGKIVIDEAAFHHDFEGLLEAALALLIWGGQVSILSTHNGDDNQFNELIQDVLAGKWPYSLHRTTFDDAVNQGLYQRICLVRGIEWSPEAEKKWVAETRAFYGDKASQELDCIPKQSGGGPGSAGC